MRQVGRYEILREIGRGGMATVYLARQAELGREVALKELSSFHVRDPHVAERFVRESRVAAALAHPNIVTVHDYFDEGGIPYIAMEYLERGSLRPYMKRLGLAQLAGVLEGALAGLAQAEASQIVHRDLKPENLLVAANGAIKIADFGIAKAQQPAVGAPALTATGATVGTPTYMAPEQALAGDIGPWTDLYSLGVIGYEALGGRLPFPEEEAPMATLLHHINDPVTPLRSLDPRIDPAMADWVERLLVKDTSERPQSAADAWDALEGILIEALGPRWRRKARLLALSETGKASDPLTPAPFESTSATPTPDPGMARATPSAEEPSAEPEGVAEGAAESSGFVTFSPPGEAERAPGREDEAAERGGEAVTEGGREEAPERRTTEPEKRGTAGEGTAAARRASRGLRPTIPPPGARELAPEGRTAESEATPTAHREATPTAEPEAIPEAEPEPTPEAEREPSPALKREPTEVAEPEATLAAERRTAPGRWRVPALVAGVALLAAAGFLLAPSGSSGEGAGPPLTSSASSPAVELRFPSTWETESEVPSPGGLELSDPVALARANPSGATIIAGIGDASGPTLLPAGRLRRQAAEQEPATVALGDLEALRYDLELGSGRDLRVYAAPTTAGVATVACAAPPGEPTALPEEDCDRIAATLTARAGRPQQLGPSAEYARALGEELDALAKSRRSGRSALDDAKVPGRQAAAANRIAAAYGRAAKSLRRVEPNLADRRAHMAIVDSLREAEGAWGDLAAAARQGSRRRYREATGEITASERRLRRSLRELEALGYETVNEADQ